jgi:hypothetical protein
MPAYREIRADYDCDSIVVYQAYNDAIADAALRAGRFAPPFSMGRMTWIKPSFLWMMERSGWGTKSNQERTLAIRITRAGWDEALAAGVLTSFVPEVHGGIDAWRSAFGSAAVHVQWDPERSIHGKKLEYRAIQVGISRRLIGRYASDWTREIRDLTALVAKLRRLRQEGRHGDARELLPRERAYPVDRTVGCRLGLT